MFTHTFVMSQRRGCMVFDFAVRLVYETQLTLVVVVVKLNNKLLFI